MVDRRDIDIVVAGHLCLDLIPAFNFAGKADGITSVLVPGKMIDMGECAVTGGGPVSNAGISLRGLGAGIELMGRVGDDDFGRILLRWYEERAGRFPGLKTVPGESTSYTVAVCIPGIDRFFLHHSGANSTFGGDDIDFDTAGRARLFLCGYPSIMRRLYENNGAELCRILKEVKERGVTTALDFSLPDTESHAGEQDWRTILESWIPLTDVMTPNAEEILFFLGKERFLRKRKDRAPGETVLDHISAKEISELGKEMIVLGCGVALIKCGSRGLYVRTAGVKRLRRFGAAQCANLENWAERELWAPAYRPEKFVNAVGAGDAAVAGFLTAFIRGHSVESCLRHANAAGSLSVTVPDGNSWSKGFEQLTGKIDSGWETIELKIDEPGWKREDDFWIGPGRK